MDEVIKTVHAKNAENIISLKIIDNSTRRVIHEFVPAVVNGGQPVFMDKITGEKVFVVGDMNTKNINRHLPSQ